MQVRRIVSRFGEVVHEGPAIAYGSAARTPAAVVALLAPLLADEPQEVFVALFLNGKQRVSGYLEVSRGTLTASLVHPREVFAPALRIGDVGALIIAHNHPSGDPEPSTEDLGVTERLRQAGELLGIPVLDHVVIGSGGNFVSLRDRGLFK